MEAFTEVMDKMLGQFNKAFDGRATVTEEEPREPLKKGGLPRIALEMVDFRKEKDPANGQIDLRTSFEARITMSFDKIGRAHV